MALKLYDKLAPSGDFALVDAADVEMADGTLLSELFEAKEVDILPLTTYGGFSLNSDYGVYTNIVKATCALTVGEIYKVYWDGETYECVAQDAGSVLGDGAIGLGNAANLGLAGNGEPFAITMAYGYVTYIALTDTEAGGEHTVRIYQKTGSSLVEQIENLDTRVETLEAPAASVDLTAYESAGTIVETYADGTQKTYTMEFDGDGNPVKITDSNGNVTVLTW